MKIISEVVPVGTTKSPLVSFEIEKLMSVRWRATAAIEWGGPNLGGVGTGDQLAASEFAGYTHLDFPPGAKGLIELYAVASAPTNARVVKMLKE